MSQKQTKSVVIKVLSAINPVEIEDPRHGRELMSPDIDTYVEEYEPWRHKLQEDFLSAKKGSVEEGDSKRRLAKLYLLKAAQRLSSPDRELSVKERDQWAERFTQASAGLYPAPRIEFVRDIITEQSKEFSGHKSPSGAYVQGAYKGLRHAALKRGTEVGGGVPGALSQQQEKELARIFLEMNADWFEYMEKNKKESYSPTELKELFSELISVRSETDERWREWSSEINDKKSHVSVFASERTITVGAQRPTASYSRAKLLVAHELGVHASRSVNGGNIDYGLATGLPGYLDIEESFGVLSELFVDGKISDGAKDKYLDIALAMGVIPGVVLSRKELIELAFHRKIVRLEAEGESISADKRTEALKKAKNHVNRIFRGGDGSAVGAPAVFTKDAVYYPAELKSYLATQLDSGKTPKQLLEFLLSGKFDPTNESHLAYLSERGIEL